MKRAFLLLPLLLGCSHPTTGGGGPSAPPPPHPDNGEVPAGPANAAVIPGATRTTPVARAPEEQPMGPGDQLPDPKPPSDECGWRPVVHCMKPSGAPQGAQAPSPYEGCSREVPASPAVASRDVKTAQLSPKSTRAARKAGDPTTCCYVEYGFTACP